MSIQNDKFKIYKSIADIFELEDLLSGWHHRKQTNKEVLVKSVWTVSFSDYKKRDALCISVAKTNKWRKGMLFAPHLVTQNKNNQFFIGNTPLISIDLNDWHDPVAENLTSVDMISTADKISLGGHSFSVETSTSEVTASIHFSPIDNPKHRKLTHSIYEAIRYFESIHKIPELNNFIYMDDFRDS